MAACLLLFLEEEDAFWMMCAIIEDLLPASYFSTTLLGVQTDQRVLRHLIVQYLPRLDKLLQEHDIGKGRPPSSLGSRGPETLTQGLRVQGLLTASGGQGGWPAQGVEKGAPHTAAPWAQHTQPRSLVSDVLTFVSSIPLDQGGPPAAFWEIPSTSCPAHAPGVCPCSGRRIPAVPGLSTELSLITLHWFLTAFASVVHIKLLLRLWDLFFYEGSLVLFQATLGMLRLKVPPPPRPWATLPSLLMKTNSPVCQMQ